MPQLCTKCKKLPEDILMLACSHDICLPCSADRLAVALQKTKRPTAYAAKSASNKPS